jgi:hypothetical protein
MNLTDRQLRHVDWLLRQRVLPRPESAISIYCCDPPFGCGALYLFPLIESLGFNNQMDLGGLF